MTSKIFYRIKQSTFEKVIIQSYEALVTLELAENDDYDEMAALKQGIRELLIMYFKVYSLDDDNMKKVALGILRPIDVEELRIDHPYNYSKLVLVLDL